MINFIVKLSNPFRWEFFKDFYNKHIPITKNKIFKFELYFYGWYIFAIDFDFSPTYKDHGGLDLSLCLLGLCIEFSIRDTRHWDFANNDWVVYD